MERVLTKPGHLHGDVHRTRNTNNGHGALHVVVVTAHLSLARLFFCDGRLYFFFGTKDDRNVFTHETTATTTMRLFTSSSFLRV